MKLQEITALFGWKAPLLKGCKKSSANRFAADLRRYSPLITQLPTALCRLTLPAVPLMYSRYRKYHTAPCETRIRSDGEGLPSFHLLDPSHAFTVSRDYTPFCPVVQLRNAPTETNVFPKLKVWDRIIRARRVYSRIHDSGSRQRCASSRQSMIPYCGFTA